MFLIYLVMMIGLAFWLPRATGWLTLLMVSGLFLLVLLEIGTGLGRLPWGRSDGLARLHRWNAHILVIWCWDTLPVAGAMTLERMVRRRRWLGGIATMAVGL